MEAELISGLARKRLVINPYDQMAVNAIRKSESYKNRKRIEEAAMRMLYQIERMGDFPAFYPKEFY
jgi:hypothetical protein